MVHSNVVQNFLFFRNEMCYEGPINAINLSKCLDYPFKEGMYNEVSLITFLTIFYHTGGLSSSSSGFVLSLFQSMIHNCNKTQVLDHSVHEHQSCCFTALLSSQNTLYSLSVQLCSPAVLLPPLTYFGMFSF